MRNPYASSSQWCVCIIELLPCIRRPRDLLPSFSEQIPQLQRRPGSRHSLEQPYEISLTAQMGNHPSSDYGGRPISGSDPPTDTEVAVASQRLPQRSVQDNISRQPDDAGTTQVLWLSIRYVLDLADNDSSHSPRRIMPQLKSTMPQCLVMKDSEPYTRVVLIVSRGFREHSPRRGWNYIIK